MVEGDGSEGGGGGRGVGSDGEILWRDWRACRVPGKFVKGFIALDCISQVFAVEKEKI